MCVADEPHDEDDQHVAIVEAAITLAHRLALTVTAEGVETPAGWQRLHDLGCDHAHGFLLSRPLPSAELERRLEARGVPGPAHIVV